jgi:spore maturation protein SpmA
MALSRIWAAFIIVAILAATFQSVFIKGNSDIYSRMVIGKSGDTSQTKIADTSAMPASILQTLQSGETYTDGSAKYSKTADGAYISYKELHADGIIATAKTAVDISINLIGIMALFMGFMAIAEKAGGIRLLSKIIGPFFSKLFPESGHGAHGNEFFS